ncbi:MAG: methionine--tRNA ligase, partial [Spirochaetota bacterium]
QTFCLSCDRFLADRYVYGTCPHCNGSNARGDQCEDCGTMLEPTDLLEARCGTCGNPPERRSTEHLFIDLPALKERLEAWMDRAAEQGRWAKNALQMTKSWLRDGLRERCITRDLNWGVPVPEMPGKVFYVWFDAPIGYISITAELLEQQGKGSQAWQDWWQNPQGVELFQFIGKDNIPFHTVLFPGTLLASGGANSKWTMLHHMSSSEYLNYESGKFSKTRGVGIFGNACQNTGIPADCWRFYLYYNRPEKSDYEFTWTEFQQLLNRELIGNLGNFVNRSLSFLQRFFEGRLPTEEAVRQDAEVNAFLSELQVQQEDITEKLEWSQIKDALHSIMALSDYGNKMFQDTEPWVLIKKDRGLAHTWLTALVYLIHDLSIYLHPYLPRTAAKIAALLALNPADSQSFAWQNLGRYERLGAALPPVEILFQPLEDAQVTELRSRFAGSQSERGTSEGQAAKTAAPEDSEDSEEANKEPSSKPSSQPSSQRWAESVELCVGRIIEVTPHPDAERLFVETVDCGEEQPRTIVSGLAEHYRPDELLGQNVAVVLNLKPAKLRGVKSMGMILAASPHEGKEASLAGQRLVEVLHPCGEPGDRIVVQGFAELTAPAKRCSIDDFFALPLFLREGRAYLQDTGGGSGLLLQAVHANGSTELSSQGLRDGRVS